MTSSNSTLLTGSKRLLEEEEQFNDNILDTPILKKHKSRSEEDKDSNSENQKRTVTKRTGDSIYRDIEDGRPRLLISTQDSLKRILKLIALITGTSYFNKVTNDLYDFNIDSIVHIIHDPSMDKSNMIVTRQRYCDDDQYEITTVKNKVSDMLQELVEQRDEFDAIDKFSSDENRLLVIKANFDKWDISFNRIVIACHATEDSIASFTWDVNFETDKYITVLRSDYDIDYFSTNMEKNFGIESHESFTDQVLVLVPEEYRQEWFYKSDAFYELFSIENYRLSSYQFKCFNEPEMIETVRNFIKSDICDIYDDDDDDEN